MSSDDKFWDRDKLYEDVWSTPMRTLAKKNGLSDVGLARICRKLSVPLPGRGYWAKKEAGQRLERLPLPAIKEKVLIEKPVLREIEPVVEDFATEHEKAQIERLECANGEAVLKRGRLAHELIVQARAVLKHASEDDRKILRTNERCLDIRVSKGSVDRALRIMAGLIGALEEEGFSVSVGAGHREETVAMIYGQPIKFGTLEKVDRVELAAPPPGGVLERVLSYGGKPVSFLPSGQLSVEIWHPWSVGRKRWKENTSRPLEEMLPQVAAGLIRIALSERSKKEKQAAEERERQRRAEDRARLEQSIKAEQSRIRALRHASANWVRAQQIRSFVAAAREAALQNGQEVQPGTPFGDWLIWAEKQTDRLDPLKESPPSIIDRKIEVEPQHLSYYGYHKPEPPFRFPKPIWRAK